MSMTAVAATAEEAPRWLLLHGDRDSTAPSLARALAEAAPADVRVEALPLSALLADAAFSLHVANDGTASCGLTGGVPSALVNRCHPLQLPPGLPDAAYKDAEWNAVIAAWLHALPGRVVNRPAVGRLHLSAVSRARWCQVAAAHGLSTWPVSAAESWVMPPRARSGLLVVGDSVFEADARAVPRCTEEMRRAAAAAAAAAGCTMLAWLGCPDEHGTWRVAGADCCPDWRAYGPAAVTALARWLASEE